MRILRYTPLIFCGAMGPQIEDKLASFLHNLEDLSTTVLTNSYQYWTICVQVITHFPHLSARAFCGTYLFLKKNQLQKKYISFQNQMFKPPGKDFYIGKLCSKT